MATICCGYRVMEMRLIERLFPSLGGRRCPTGRRVIYGAYRWRTTGSSLLRPEDLDRFTRRERALGKSLFPGKYRAEGVLNGYRGVAGRVGYPRGDVGITLNGITDSEGDIAE